MLEPGERGRQATADQDLQDLGDLTELEPGSAGLDRRGDRVQAGLGECPPMGWRYDAGPVDLGGGREQDVVGDPKGLCSQGAPARGRVLSAHGVHRTSQ